MTRAGAPDYVAPTVGWRGWLVVEVEGSLRLCSPRYWTVWPPRAELVALCRLGERCYWPLHGPVPAHAAPDQGCRCGVYAAPTATQAAASVTAPARPREEVVHHVIGRVTLWGTVVECERGWRAERAYPASLAVPAPRPEAPKRHILRRRRQRSPSRPAAEIAAALCEYGVPVELVACETLGELASAFEARAGGAVVSGQTVILSAGERAALLAALTTGRRFSHRPATATTAVIALERAERVRGGYRVLLPDEGCGLLDDLRRGEGEMR